MGSYTETFSMSTTVCASNYEYQGQVYSPAFSEPSSPMSSSSTTSSEPPSPKPSNHDYHDYFEEEEVFVSKRPKFANKYEEMLQPLDPVRILPSHQIVKHNNRSKQLVPKKTHQSNVDKKLQEQFQNLMLLVCKQQTTAENVNKTAAVDQVEDFLTEHLEKLDINQFNREGRTALQQSCLEGNLPLAKVLVKFGANSRIMTREGFSTLHLAVFSGHSHLMSYVMSLR